MYYLFAYILGVCSVIAAWQIFARPDSYYKNRCKGLEDENARLEKLLTKDKLDSETLLKRMK